MPSTPRCLARRGVFSSGLPAVTDTAPGITSPFRSPGTALVCPSGFGATTALHAMRRAGCGFRRKRDGGTLKKAERAKSAQPRFRAPNIAPLTTWPSSVTRSDARGMMYAGTAICRSFS
jgi:hypothetical protein